MSENNAIKPSTISIEAPASWNTRYVTSDGFICQLTLRADSGKELLEKAKMAVSHLLEIGCLPCDNSTSRGKGNWKGANKQTTSSVGLEKNSETQTCPIHNVEMRRFEKDGRIWHAHRSDEGWCNGKQK
jgi:hypothetical protein